MLLIFFVVSNIWQNIKLRTQRNTTKNNERMFIEHKNEDTYLHNVKNQETDNTKEMTLIKKKTRVIDQSRPEGLFIHNPQMEEKKLPCTLF